MNRTHELAAHYDRLRHEVDSMSQASGHDTPAVERLIGLLDQAHADFVSACRASLGDRSATHVGAAVGAAAHPPSMVQPTEEGPAQPGALPAHWEAR